MFKKNVGKMIAVFGPDGTGKSSIYNALKNSTDSLVLSHFHWRPGFLPYKKVLKDHRVDRFDKPHNTKIRNTFLSILLLLYIYFDFVFSYIFILRPQLKKGINIFYERYFYDILIDQNRYGLNAPFWLRNFLRKAMFLPDYIILLEAPGDVIYSRKRELSAEKIDEQCYTYRKLLGGHRNTIIFDVLKMSAEDCSKKIISIVLQRYSENHD